MRSVSGNVDHELDSIVLDISVIGISKMLNRV